MGAAALEERAKILVVDDSPRNLELMQAILTVAGYEVTTASEGEEALLKVQQEPPDLVLLDVMMPKLDGYQVCARLKEKEETRLIPIILTSPVREEEIRGIEVGSDGFLRKPFSRLELLARVRSLVKTKRLNDKLINLENSIVALARAVEARDPYAEGHIERVANYAARLGKEIGLSQREQELLRKGGILHDVGKIGVRDSVLLKQGPLSQEDMEELRIHTTIGERICQPLKARTILEMVRYHHERYDGKGYPDGLAGEDIPLASRVIAVVDAYDALTNDRPYRRRLSQEQAMAVLSIEAGRQFDPRLALSLIDLVETGRLS